MEVKCVFNEQMLLGGKGGTLALRLALLAVVSRCSIDLSSVPLSFLDPVNDNHRDDDYVVIPGIDEDSFVFCWHTYASDAKALRCQFGQVDSTSPSILSFPAQTTVGSSIQMKSRAVPRDLQFLSLSVDTRLVCYRTIGRYFGCQVKTPAQPPFFFFSVLFAHSSW